MTKPKDEFDYVGEALAAAEYFRQDPFCVSASELLDILSEEIYARINDNFSEYGAAIVLTDHFAKFAFEYVAVLYGMMSDEERAKVDFPSFATDALSHALNKTAAELRRRMNEQEN